MLGALQIGDEVRQAVASGTSYRDRVISDDSVRERMVEVFEAPRCLSQSVVLGDGWYKAESKSTLTNLYNEQKVYGWDGEEGIPVTELTYSRCLEFIDSLPFYSTPPRIIPDPDGEVSFEWRDKGRMLSVSVGGNGRLTYIAREGINRPSDTLHWFGGQLPMVLRGMIVEF